MLDWIYFLNPRSQLAASLATRYRALAILADPFELDGVPLAKGNGEPFDFSSPFGTPSLFASLCRVTDGPAIGTIVGTFNGQLFFVGVQQHIYRMAAAQNLKTIMEYRDYGGSTHKRIHCVLPRSRARQLGVLPADERPRERLPYVVFPAAGTLHYGHGASVFGAVSLDSRAEGSPARR